MYTERVAKRTREKNSAAVELAKLRAKKLSPERRSEIASVAGVAGSEMLTPEERSERARAAVKERWKRYRQKKAGKT